MGGSEELEVPLFSQVENGGDGDDMERDTPKAAGFRRWVVMAMCFLGLMLVYMMRVDLSIAVLSMDPQFRWNHMPSDPKGFVLSSFYVGYILGQIPGGLIATKCGGNIIFGVGVLATGLFTMLLPLATCGSLECPSYLANETLPPYADGSVSGSRITCGVADSNAMFMTITNQSKEVCYNACLNTCFQHGNRGDVCEPKFDGTANECTSNCTLDSFCSHFFYQGNDTDSSDNLCFLFYDCEIWSGGLFVAGGGETYDVQTTSYLGAVYVLRILMGIFESVTYPSFYALLSKWTPASERSSMVGFAAGGAYFGTAIAFPVCSILVASTIPVIGRWPGIFYLFGAMTLVCFVLVFESATLAFSIHFDRTVFTPSSDCTVTGCECNAWCVCVCRCGQLLGFRSFGRIQKATVTYLEQN